LFFHYKVPGFSGGFSGVDVFFVISGYLMTKIILTGIDKGKFSLIDFYNKRLNRIAPALLVVILIITLICFFCYFPGDYQSNLKNAATSIMFVSNIFYWKSSGYFASASDSNIFLHTWSLSVEWQFYMLYPLALLLLNKYVTEKKKLLILLCIATLLSCVASILYFKHDPDATFYLLPTRSWEMMFGGIALLSQDYFKNVKGRKLIVLISYLIIFIGVVFFNSDMGWPGIYTVVPVLATFFIIAINVNTFKVLKSPPVQFLGRISYSLYLWHWPIFVVGQYMDFNLNLLTVLSMTSISLVAAYLSYTYVESFKFSSSKPILVSMVALLAITGLFSFNQVNKSVFRVKALKVFNYEKEHKKESEEQFKGGGACFITSKTSVTNEYDKQNCLSISPGAKNILLIGDSHSAHLAGPLRKELAKMNINLMQASASSCLPFIRTNGASFCSDIIDYTYKDFLVKNADKIDGVIISASWVLMKDKKEFLNDMHLTLDHLKKYKIKVIIIGQNETYSIPYPTLKAKEIEYGSNLTKKYLTSRSYEIDKFVKASFKPIYISIINDTIPELKDGYVPYIFDKHHYTTYGANLTIQKILSDPITQTFLK
jgi:peptidoglycan/LPS O-acetylase OafA/YrhL